MPVSNVFMRTISWRWALPFAQLMLATAALLYAPYELRSRYHPVGDDFMLLRYRSVFPPPVLRMSYALNFPALAAVVPFRFWGSWSSREAVLYKGPPFLSLSIDDCMFLSGVFVVWYWLGSWVDRRKHPMSRDLKSKWTRIFRPTIGCLLSVEAGTLASYYVMLTDADRPFREIGMAGLVWAFTLLWYFVGRLISGLRAPSAKIQMAR
jgi:hypothetical protein